jgi:hypothetical protein
VLCAARPAPIGEVEHVTQPNGQQVWKVADILHRLDGPALEWADGTSFWYFNDELHRDDGPAIEWADGSREWHRHGQLHRTDGPATHHSAGLEQVPSMHDS